MLVSIYKHELLGYKSIKHGFNWVAFFFPVIWAAINKFWILAICLFITSQIVTGFVVSQMNPHDSQDTHTAMLLIFHTLFFDLPLGIFFGINGNSKIRTALQIKGYELLCKVEADSCESALALNISNTRAQNEMEELSQLKTCPFCAESIKKEANVCKHCGRDII